MNIERYASVSVQTRKDVARFRFKLNKLTAKVVKIRKIRHICMIIIKIARAI